MRDIRRSTGILVGLMLLLATFALPALAHYDPEAHSGIHSWSPVKTYGNCQFRVQYDSDPAFHATSYVQELGGCAYLTTDVYYRDYGYEEYEGGSFTNKIKYCSAQSSSFECQEPGLYWYTNLTAKVRGCGTYTSPWYVCGTTGWYYP